MIQFNEAQPLIEALEGNEFAFVPTMGNLHLGHLSLIRTAKELNIPVVCSILVNKLQFGANEDFDSYPRTLSADLDALKELGCDYVFTPNNDLYHDIDELKCAPIAAHESTTTQCNAASKSAADVNFSCFFG